jgi:hypothetical protein
MRAAAAAPLRRLAPLTAAVLAVHVMLLQMHPDAMLLPGKPAGRSFITRTITLPQAPEPEAAPAPPVPRPVRRPRAAAPAPEPPAAQTATAPEAAPQAEAPPARIPGDIDSGGPVAMPGATAVTTAPPAPPAGAAPSGLPQVLAIPVPSRLRYEVVAEVRGLSFNGHAQLDWRHDGTQYEARLELGGPLLPTRVQRSVGRIGEEGLAPQTFSDKSRTEQATHFDRDKGRITFSNNRPDAVLAAGTQDRLSVVVQLAVLIGGQPERFPAGTQIAIPTASTREAESWVFSVEGEEELRLPGGPVRALKLQRLPRKEFDQKVELWLAPRMDYAPVRLRLTNPNGDTVDQRWSSTDKG